MSEEFTVIGRIRTAKGRSYPVVLDRASRFGTRFQVTDASVPALAALVRDFPEELNKALEQRRKGGAAVLALMMGAAATMGGIIAKFVPLFNGK